MRHLDWIEPIETDKSAFTYTYYKLFMILQKIICK